MSGSTRVLAAALGMALGLLAVMTVAAESVSPELAQRVLELLERAEADPDEALEKLDYLANRARSDADLAFVATERAALLIQQDRLETARDEMAEVLAGRPPEFAPRLRNLYATTLLAEEAYQAALVQLEHWAANVEAPHPGGLFLMGYAYVRLDRFEDAVRVLEQAISADYPTRDQWVELLAYAYTRAGRPEAAVTLLENLIADHPDRARWWKQLAGIFMLLDRLPAGTASLSISADLQPLTMADSRRLARLYAHLGMPADGAQVLAAALEGQDDAAGFEDLMLLGELWMLAREADQAIVVFRDAQRLAEDGEPAMMIGQLYAQREEYEPAGAALRASAEAFGEAAPAQLYYLLAVIEINLGNLDAAAAAVDRLLADDRYRKRGENLMAYLNSTLGQP